MIIVCNYFTAGSGDGRRKRRNSGRGSDSPDDKSAVSVLLQIQSLISFWIFLSLDYVTYISTRKLDTLQRLRQCNYSHIYGQKTKMS